MAYRHPSNIWDQIEEDLDTLEQRRRAQEAARTDIAQRMERVFKLWGTSIDKDPKAVEVKDFLSVAIRHFDAEAHCIQVGADGGAKVQGVDWIELCGAAIAGLSARPSVKQLLLDFVSSLLPEENAASRVQMARLAGLSCCKRVTPKNVDTLKRQGMVSAFVAKLFVDSKALQLDGTEEAALDYFKDACSLARRMERSFYLTEKDLRFLSTCRKKHGGDLAELVEHEKKRALEGIVKRDQACEPLERVLRQLLSEGYSVSRDVEDLKSWWKRMQPRFGPGPYVMTRISELRERVVRSSQKAMEIEVDDPKKELENLRRLIFRLIEKFNAEVVHSGFAIAFDLEGDQDLMETLAANASELGRRDLVEAFNRLVSEQVLADVYGRYQATRIKMGEVEMRRGLSDDLAIWEEIGRCMKLDEAARGQEAALRSDMVDLLRKRGKTVSEELAGHASVFGFARGILGLMDGAEDLNLLNIWLSRVRLLYGSVEPPPERAPAGPFESRDLPAKEDETPAGSKIRESTLVGVPLLGRAAPFQVDLQSLPGLEEVHPSGRTNGVRSWRGWPWNWRSHAV